MYAIVLIHHLLPNVFEILIQGFIDDKVGITNQFLTDELAVDLQKNLLRLFANKHLKEASIGKKSDETKNTLVRNDQIFWLDKLQKDAAQDLFFARMDEFVAYLNRTCYTGVVGYEFHYAYYGKGSFYLPHLDQFQGQSTRAYTMIFYLNEGWQTLDGGELCIHHADTAKQLIAPIFGKTVFFKSAELVHEVLETTVPRLSIVGWLKTA